MDRVPNPNLSRRSLLRNTGIAISMGAVIAACGSDRGGPVNPGRLGVAEPLPTLPPATVDDSVLLRTAQSIEYTILDVYAAVLDLGVLDEAETALVERFVADHQAHADTVGDLVAGAGGEPFPCGNPFLAERVVDPLLAAIADSDDQHRDAVETVYALETFAGESYQALTTALSESTLRVTAITIATEEHRHAAAFATLVNPETPFGPEVTGETAPETDVPILYAVPATFGPLTGVPLQVGAPNEEGARTSLTLQTPADNSYVYEYLSCDA